MTMRAGEGGDTMSSAAKHEKFEGERTLMRIHVGESDQWHGQALYQAIVNMLRAEKFSGVTVLRGVGGYGSSSIYHTEKVLRMSQDLPMVIEVVEFTERIEAILPKMDEMIGGGLVTLEKVRVILYRSAKK
jgi:PII-like signaling protein